MKPLTLNSTSLRQRNLQLIALERQHDLPYDQGMQDPPIKEKVNFDGNLKSRRQSEVSLRYPPGRRQSDANLKNGDSDSSDDDGDFSTFETYLVMEFARDINQKTLYWIIDKMRGKKMHGGAGLILRKEPPSDE